MRLQICVSEPCQTYSLFPGKGLKVWTMSSRHIRPGREKDLFALFSCSLQPALLYDSLITLNSSIQEIPVGEYFARAISRFFADLFWCWE